MVLKEKSKPKVSIILPTYNEAGNINKLICKIFDSFNFLPELIVVDDDSPDETWKVAQKLQSTHSTLKVIRRTHERGLTSSLKEGIKEAEGEIIGWLDCDLSMPAEILPEMVLKIESGFDIVMGSRYVVGGIDARDDKFAILSSSLICKFSKFILSKEILDYTSGFVVCKKSVLSKIELVGDYGEYFIDFIYRSQKAGFRIYELPYSLVSRKWGKSKTRKDPLDFTIKGFKYFFTILRLKITV